MQHQGRKCKIKEGNVIKIENAIHQSRKCNIKIENVIIGRKCNINDHSVQRKIKKDKIQRWWNSTQGNLSTISRLKMQHWSGWFEVSLNFFLKQTARHDIGRAPTRWALSITVSELRSNFSSKIWFSFISLLELVSWSSPGMLSTRILFLRL